jgi:hypothetical protein
MSTRQSIVKLPVSQDLTYRILNNADLLSSLVFAWFDASDSLISKGTKTNGTMSDWTFTPIENAETISITLKSGNTDSEAWNNDVHLFSSTDGDFTIQSINNSDIRDNRVPDLIQEINELTQFKEDINREVYGVDNYTEWLEFGISSGGGLNAIDYYSHTNLLPVEDLSVISSTSDMYRINYFDSDQAYIGQANFTGGSSFTVPEGLGVAYVMISSHGDYETKTTVVTITPPNSSNTIQDSRISALESSSIKSVTIDGEEVASNNTVTLVSATSSKSGLLSALDKQKLDALVRSISIEGSGVTKNALAYNFLPTNDATDNVAALQSAVAGGGLILVDYEGVYDVNESILLDSNTLLVLAPNVTINKVAYNGKSPRYTFINRGAFTKEWNKNIGIVGLKIICNGIGNGSDSTTAISGLRGHVAFHYIENLYINKFELLDGDAQSYVIHICTFKNILLERLNIEGYKDAVHLGNGDDYHIRGGRFKTYDDPIALNAHDYSSGQPELGWLTNGLIEDCYDLADEVRGTTGYFARILAGAWVDWFSGMEVQQSDTIVASNGKMYRVFNSSDGTVYTSNTEPSHNSGTVTIDGINWKMIQDSNVTYTAGVKGVKFKNIHLQKPRVTALSIHFDNDKFSRSYYPNAESPIQDDIVFEDIHMEANIASLISCKTPLGTVKVIGGELGTTNIGLKNLGTDGIEYGATNILMLANTFKGDGVGALVSTETGRTAKVKIVASVKENDTYAPVFGDGVTIQYSDL